MSEEIKNNEAVVEGEAMMDMATLMEQYGALDDEVSRGTVMEGTIVDVVDGGWLVDVGYKCEGFLSRREWSHHMIVDDEAEPKKGDKVTVQVTSKRDAEEAQMTVSRWRCEFDRRWEELEKETADGAVVTVRGLRKVKGGLMVNCCGLEGFVPMSHLSAGGRGINPGSLVDEEIKVRLLEKDKRKRRLVLSRRSVLDERLVEERAKFYEEVKVGAILDGTVSSVTSFGLFVNVGPIDGLVHVSEISWKRAPKFRDEFKKGDEVKVKVIGIDQEHDKISLSIRQVEGNPWDTVSERWAKGQKTKGIVTNVTDFGAFVEVEPGIEGLIHIGDLSWTRIKHPRDVIRKGQEVDTIVLDIDADRRRMSLGYKQLNDPWNGIDERYTAGQDINVKVVRLCDFGAFVEVEKGVEGLIHISQISTKRVEKPGDVLSEGQEVTARVLEVNPEERRMRLSIRAIEAGENPEESAAAAAAPRNERRSNRGGNAPRNDRPARGGNRRRQEERPAQNFIEDTGVTLGDLFAAMKDKD